jgi:hypothetical protein
MLSNVDGLGRQIEIHLAKIARQPGAAANDHWIVELNGWIKQIEAVLPNIGRKTAAEVAARIALWKAMFGG